MKIMVISSHTPSLITFRLDMMQEFIKRGHDVVALGHENESKWNAVFKNHDIEYRQIKVNRNGLNPISDMQTYSSIKELINSEKPNKIFAYQAKPIIYGSLAAKSCGISSVYPLIAGLGSVFRGVGLKNWLIKSIMKYGYHKAFDASEMIFVQNEDDKQELINHNMISELKVKVINGSGVNLGKFLPEPISSKSNFLFVGRLIKDKGIVEYLEACKLIKEEYPDIVCSLIGQFDSNPSSLKLHELQPYIEQGIIEYHGEQSDIRPFLKECTTLVLPSYHEGTPKVILEAMATGRSIITCDSPGCRQTVENGKNGYLVPIKDINELTNKMKILVENKDLVKLMGVKSLEIARKKYDVDLVNVEILKTMKLL